MLDRWVFGLHRPGELHTEIGLRNSMNHVYQPSTSRPRRARTTTGTGRRKGQRAVTNSQTCFRTLLMACQATFAAPPTGT